MKNANFHSSRIRSSKLIKHFNRTPAHSIPIREKRTNEQDPRKEIPTRKIQTQLRIAFIARKTERIPRLPGEDKTPALAYCRAKKITAQESEREREKEK